MGRVRVQDVDAASKAPVQAAPTQAQKAAPQAPVTVR